MELQTQAIEKTSETNQDEALRRDFGQLREVLERLISRRGGRTAGAAAILAAATARRAEATVHPPLDQRLVLLICRVTGSFEIAEYDAAVQAGFTGYLNNQLNLTTDPAPGQWIGADPTLNHLLSSTPLQLMTTLLDEVYWARALQSLTLARSLLTARRIYDRMVEMWSDHVNIDVYSKSLAFLKPKEDRDVIRNHALGNFQDLLVASANSSAMMWYLDNFYNKALSPQENYARELLELHSVGVNGGYNEPDIKDVASILTGWTVEMDLASPNFGLFKYDSNIHTTQPTSYSILKLLPPAFQIAVGPGQKGQGDQLLIGLGAHDSTAQYVAKKAARFLLAYDNAPTFATFVSAIEAAYKTGPRRGDIKAMIQAALTVPHVDLLRGTSPTTLKIKRPKQLAVGLIRAVGGVLRPLNQGIANPCEGLLAELDVLGNSPHAWGPPDGYPDSEAAWSGGVMSRWALADKLLRNQVAGIDVTDPTILNFMGNFDSSKTGEHLSHLLTGQNMRPLEVSLLQAFVDYGLQQGWNPMILLRDVIALAASFPSYQYC